VVAETRERDPGRRDALAAAVTDRVAAAIGVPPDEVTLVPPGAAPKTSSGKIRRADTKRLYLEGALGRPRRDPRGRRVLLLAAAVWSELRPRLALLPRALYAAHLAALRAQLEAERERLRGILQGLDAEVQAAEPASDEPEDFSEMGRDLTEEGTARALAADQERLLAQVERALQRMDEGTYGLSEVSGRPIPLERLEVLPWATTTVDDPAEP